MSERKDPDWLASMERWQLRTMAYSADLPIRVASLRHGGVN